MATWTIAADFYQKSAVRVFEHGGAPVLVTLGGYPSAVSDDGRSTKSYPHVLLAVYSTSTTRPGEPVTTVYTSLIASAQGTFGRGGRRRVLTAFKLADRSELDVGVLIEEAVGRIDEAVGVLASLDATYDAAEARICAGWAYVAPLARGEYEAACAVMSVPVMSDADVDADGVKFGDFDYPHYDPDYIVQMHLARLRQRAVEVEKAAPAPTQAELDLVSLVEEAAGLEERAQEAEDREILSGPKGAWALQAKAREVRAKIAAARSAAQERAS